MDNYLILGKTMALEQLNAQDIIDLLASCSNLDREISVIVKESLPSTNDYLFEMVKNSETLLPKMALLVETQTAGKGRQGRVWVSPPGNIYLSLYWPFKGDLNQMYGLSLVVGIAVARVLKANGLDEVKLKWPNDIFWQERKLGGILIETRQNAVGMIDTIIGLGLNIQSMDEYSAEITQKHVGLETAVQHKIYRNKLVAQLLIELDSVLKQFADDGFEVFVDEWKSFDTCKGENLQRDQLEAPFYATNP